MSSPNEQELRLPPEASRAARDALERPAHVLYLSPNSDTSYSKLLSFFEFSM